MPSVFSVAAVFAVSSSSVEGACDEEEAEDDYNEGPKDVPEVGDISAFLEK